MKDKNQILSELHAKLETRGRSLPRSEEMEKNVLGCIMLSSESADSAFEVLTENPFYSEQHRIIFQALKSLYEKKEYPDLVTVSHTVKELGIDLLYLTELTFSVTPYSLRQHCLKVNELYLKRKLALTFDLMVAECMIDEQPLDEILDTADVEILKIRSGEKKKEPKHISSFTESLFAKESRDGVRVGITDLDEVLHKGEGLHGGDYVIIGARPSVGKAQPLDAKVLTPTGFVRMGDLRVNDLVVGADGKGKRVTGVYPQGVKNIYEVVLWDGRKTRCCHEHLWLTSNKSERLNGESSVKSTEEIIRTLRRGDTLQHEIPMCSPVEFSPVVFAINPYLLGVYLGDGHYDNSIHFSNSEADVVNKIKDTLSPLDELVPITNEGIYFRVRRKQRNNEVSELRKSLDLLGLANKKSHEKFIPEEYLYSSVDQRLELLRGLLDTDGFVHRSGQRLIEYTTASKQLAEDVRFIVMSLGGMVSIQNRVPKFTYKGERKNGLVNYRLHIRLKNKLVPVSSKKHLERYNADGVREKRQMIKSITFVGGKKCQCISVEGGLYITDEFIVTHNTTLAINFASYIADTTPVLFFSAEMKSDSIVRKIFEYHSGIPSWKLKEPYVKNITAFEDEQIQIAIKKLEASQFHIDDSSGLTPLDIRARVARWKQRYGIKAVFIDYIQLLRPAGNYQNREREIGSISQALKEIAKEYDVPVVALSQLNRQSVGKESKRPSVSELRDSGSLEQDADIIILPYDPLQVDTGNNADERELELIVAKNREGRCTSVHTTFFSNISTFKNKLIYNENNLLTVKDIKPPKEPFKPDIFRSSGIQVGRSVGNEQGESPF